MCARQRDTQIERGTERDRHTDKNTKRDTHSICVVCGTRWHIGRVDAFQPKGRGFESRSSRHIGTLGKSLTRNCLWYFGVKLQHSIRAVSGALLSSRGLEEVI